MQIFWLHRDLDANATHYSDRHVNKIILEIAQCVSTALRKKGYEDKKIYRDTHKNHPVVEWLEESSANIEKSIAMAHHLNEEFKYRDKNRSNHKSWMILDQIDINRARQVYDKHTKTTPPLAISSDIDVSEAGDMDEVVRAYRDYYVKEKLVWSDGKIAQWTKRGRPDWVSEKMRDPFTETQIDFSGLNV